ncbi:hypothetical protein DPMN_106667 [Dreissena polymorpha]|uniref:Uncharacterized protein n=1 Tax=Dreissena polymorpha TaxID=45954 RepID=A0A9D4K5C8_DREPO|nr:hypothetical protein DPMN_106667 [Dreissena polymorpha]
MPLDSLSRLALCAQCHLTHYQRWPRLHNATRLTFKASHVCTLPTDSHNLWTTLRDMAQKNGASAQEQGLYTAYRVATAADRPKWWLPYSWLKHQMAQG